MKPSAPEKAEAKQPSGGGNVALPAIAMKARMGVELLNAHVVYKDLASGLSSEATEFNFILRDISLTRPTEIEISADLNTKMAGVFAVKGPFALRGQAQPTISGGKFDHATLNAKLDLDQLEIAVPGVFEKKKGMAANATLAVNASDQQAKVEKFEIKFFNADLTANGTVTNLQGTPTVNVALHSNPIDLKPWVQLVPSLKDFDLAGKMQLDASAQGPSDKLGYRAKLAIEALTAKAPKLKAEPRIDALISVVTDQVDKLSLTMKAPGNDLSINGKIVSFTKPHADIEIASNGLDLDQLIDFPPPSKAEKKSEPAKAAGGGGGGGGTAKKEDVDASLDSLRTNKSLAESAANIGVKIKSIKAQGTKISDLSTRLVFKDLVAGIQNFTMGVFGGTIQANLVTQLKPKTPTYQVGVSVKHLDLKQTLESQYAPFKNTLTGSANFAVNGTGASFNTDAAMANLNAKGNFKVDQASFATVDVAKMVNDALNGSLAKLGEKFPALAGKKVGVPPGGATNYEFISSDFTIAGGKFTSPDFYAKSLPNESMDIKGDTSVGLKDKALNCRLDVIDTYNLTHARDLSLNQQGVQVDHILAEGNGPVHLIVHVGCTLDAPCYSYTEVPQYLLSVAAKNVENAVVGHAKSEAQKQAQQQLQKVVPQAPPPVQNAIKGLFQ
ncbi:MAG: hypothetical protein ACXVBC_12175, partial [Bdellovibrionota bacterium]